MTKQERLEDAAPELLAACVLAIDVLTLDEIDAQEAVDALEAAIEKAVGFVDAD